MRILLTCIALLAMSSPALAQAVAETSDKVVVLPWGLWIKAIGDTLEPIVVTAAVTFLTGLVGTIAWPIRLFISNALIDRMVRTAIDYAQNAVEGAVKGQVLTVPVGSQVIAKAVQRAVDSTPGWIVKAAGGPEGIAARVFRMLHMEPGASEANTLQPAVDSALSLASVKRAA